jgi:hypothetical protein
VAARELVLQMVDAINARDWTTLARMLDERTVVEDHRDLPFEGDGARMLGVWRSVFDTTATGTADLDVLEARDDAAVIRLGLGDEEGRLAVHAAVAVDGERITRFDAFPATTEGERGARARYGG